MPVGHTRAIVVILFIAPGFLRIREIFSTSVRTLFPPARQCIARGTFAPRDPDILPGVC